MLSVPQTVRITTWQEKLFSPGDTVYVALSGGADSVTLLYLMCDMKEELNLKSVRALHVNHGLRGIYADRDESFVRELCDLLHVPLTVERVDVPAIVRKTHKTIEEAARDARYDFFRRATEGVEGAKIATAHTIDDQVETVLMRILRGCSPHGLCGIPHRRGNIVRPLLDCSAEEVRRFAKEQGYIYIYDETNDDDRYTRNYIRNRIMPAVKQINPAAVSAISRLSNLAAADDAYLQSEAQSLLKSAALENDAYDCTVLASAPVPIASRALIAACAQAGSSSPQWQHIESLLQIVRNTGSITLPGDMIARSDGNTLHFYKADRTGKTIDTTQTLSFSVGDTFSFFDKHYTTQLLTKSEFDAEQKVHKNLLQYSVNYDMIKGNIYLRTREWGDTFRPHKRNCTKTLKQFFQEQGIPAEQRGEIPLLCDEIGILAVLGYSADERAAISEDTRNVLCIKLLPEGSK